MTRRGQGLPPRTRGAGVADSILTEVLSRVPVLVCGLFLWKGPLGARSLVLLCSSDQPGLACSLVLVRKVVSGGWERPHLP